jgi:hypothetical protein
LDAYDIAVCGGLRDPSLRVFTGSAHSAGLRVLDMRHNNDSERDISFDFAERQLSVDGVGVSVRAAFVRFDVFSGAKAGISTDLPRSPGWFAAMHGWLAACPEIACFNREMVGNAGSKVHDLHIARTCGLAVPQTFVSNSRSLIEKISTTKSEFVAKPVGGGGYCFTLEDAINDTQWLEGRAPIPAYIQERLSYPEYRVYRVGEEIAVFKLHSEKLDYRTDPHSDMQFVTSDTIAPDLREKLMHCADRLGLDYCAFDLKTRASTGELCFLEVNSGPMFAAHDRVSSGHLCKMMLSQLVPGTAL